MCVEVCHLRHVVAAAEHRSFRRAAAALNITQPTLSKRIRELENRLGVVLFERSTGGVQLTGDGEDIVVRAKWILTELEGIEDRARAGKAGRAGHLELGFYTSLAGPLRNTLSVFARQHTQVDVNITEDSRSSLITLLDRGIIDIVVVLGDAACLDFAYMNLWSERILVALPKTHALARRDFVYWTDLKNERFLMSQCDPGPEIQNVLLNKLSSPGNGPLIKQIRAHHSLIMSAVEGDYGITLVCESSSFSPSPGVVFREARDGNGPTRIGFIAYWRRNNDSPILRQFLSLLQAHMIGPPRSDATD